MRQNISPETQARILAESRRRCAACYGLHHDIDRKKGQIAHLGKDPSKTDESELVFLCFDHHDEFDSTTRQSKNLTRKEIERYRDDLIAELEKRWSKGPLDAPVKTPPFSINVAISGGPGGAGGVFGGGGGGGAGVGAGGEGGQG